METKKENNNVIYILVVIAILVIGLDVYEATRNINVGFGQGFTVGANINSNTSPFGGAMGGGRGNTFYMMQGGGRAIREGR